MLAQVFIILSVANVAFSVQNLRASPVVATASESVSAAKAAAALNSMLVKAEQMQHNDAAFLNHRSKAAAKSAAELKANAKSVLSGASCEPGWHLGHGKCYYFDAPDGSWEQCHDFCGSNEMRAKMTCIENTVQNNYVNEMKQETYWTGYNDLANEGNFAWPQGCPSQYSNFKPGEPNDGQGNEDCVASEYPNQGVWNDATCSEPLGCVCEKTMKWDVVTEGYQITRHRPNGDCSGVSTFTYAQKLDSCHAYGGGNSARTGCTHRDANGVMSAVFGYFDNEDCTGLPFSTYMYGIGDQCAFNMANLQDLRNTSVPSLPEMQSIQCSGETATALKHGGIVSMNYAHGDDMCQHKPDSYTVEKFGACNLFVMYDETGKANEHTRYEYTSVESCTHDGQMTIVFHSDSACKRETARATIDARHGRPDFNMCSQPYQGASHMTKSMCVAPGGPLPFNA